MPIAAVTVIGSQLIPATARADLHNITYRARIDAVTTGSQATFVINGGQTNTTIFRPMPGNVFEANTVLPDPQQAGMRIVLHLPYSANVHCEIDVDDNVFTQADQMVRPAPGNADPNERCAAVRRTPAQLELRLGPPAGGIGPLPRPPVGVEKPRLLGGDIGRGVAVRACFSASRLTAR